MPSDGIPPLESYFMPTVRKTYRRGFDLVPSFTTGRGHLWRFISLEQLIDLFLHKRLRFSVPEDLRDFDPLDGAPNSDLCNQDISLLLQAIGESEIKSLSPTDRSAILRILRNSVSISCWTYGGESYAMWRAYSDPAWGICLQLSYEAWNRWAAQEDEHASRPDPDYERALDAAPVQYLSTAEDSPGEGKTVDVFTAYAAQSCAAVLSKGYCHMPVILREAPLQWFKSDFFRTEWEYRFGRRKKVSKLKEEWDNRGSLAFQPTFVSFDPSHWLDDGESAIITGPNAPDWYHNLVQETVGSFAPGIQVKRSDGFFAPSMPS